MFSNLFTKKKVESTCQDIATYNSFDFTLTKKSVKSLVLQTNQEGKFSGNINGGVSGFFLGISGDYKGSYNGELKSNLYYHVLVEYAGKGLILERYNAEEVYIQESEGVSYIETKGKFVIVDSDSLYNDTIFSIDNVEYMKSAYIIEPIDSNIKCPIYDKVDTYDLNYSTLEELMNLGLSDGKELICRDLTTTLYVPKNTIFKEFNISLSNK